MEYLKPKLPDESPCLGVQISKKDINKYEMSDVSEIVKEYTEYLKTLVKSQFYNDKIEKHLTNFTVEEGLGRNSETFEQYNSTKNEILDGVETVNDFIMSVSSWLSTRWQLQKTIYLSDRCYVTIYHIFSNPFIWTIFKYKVPPLSLVDFNAIPNTEQDHYFRGVLPTISLAKDSITLALNKYNITLSGTASDAIISVVRWSCFALNSMTDNEIKFLIGKENNESLGDDTSALLFYKLLSIIIEDLINKSLNKKFICYKDAIQSILNNSLWPHFNEILSI